MGPIARRSVMTRFIGGAREADRTRRSMGTCRPGSTIVASGTDGAMGSNRAGGADMVLGAIVAGGTMGARRTLMTYKAGWAGRAMRTGRTHRSYRANRPDYALDYGGNFQKCWDFNDPRDFFDQLACNECRAGSDRLRGSLSHPRSRSFLIATRHFCSLNWQTHDYEKTARQTPNSKLGLSRRSGTSQRTGHSYRGNLNW